MEEFTALEAELEQLFVQYSVRLRCLNQLEKLVGDAERAHIERQQMAALKNTREVIPLENEEHAELFSLDDLHQDGKEDTSKRQERPVARTGGESWRVFSLGTLIQIETNPR